MKTSFCFALLLAVMSFIACKEDEEPYNPYPVWLLEVEVVEENETGIDQPVTGCPQGIFHVLPMGSDSTVNCYAGTNEVKIWNHIDSTITIVYYIECEGYFRSEDEQVTFRIEDAVQEPGRDGPEVRVHHTVVLDPS